MRALELSLWLVSIAGVVGTFYFGVKSIRLTKERQRFTWSDVTLGCRNIANKSMKRLKPDIIICFSGPSAIIANLVVEFSNHFVPIYVIVIEKVSEKRSPRFTIPDYEPFVTSKWRLHLPSGIFSDTSCKLLIVDDSVMSGDSLKQIREVLIEHGFGNERICTCSLICSSIAERSGKAPDIYCYLVQNSEFFLPWGKGY